MKRLLVLILFVFASSISTSAVPFTFYVNPGNRIQDTIDLAIDGDVIIVRDGTYTGDGNRDIDFPVAGIVLTLQSPSV